jgi:hypothetical protein
VTLYRFHIALRYITPKIWRRVVVSADNSLADLQKIIQLSMDWSDEYQHRFTIRNHHLGASRPGGLLLIGNTAEMRLSQFEFRSGERFQYEYNFFDAWIIDIRFEEAASGLRLTAPRCIAGARRAPSESCGGAEAFMDQIRPSVTARRARRTALALGQLAELADNAAVDDVAFRTQARRLLTRKAAPEFDRRSLNVALTNAFANSSSRGRSSHGDQSSDYRER